MFVDHLNDRLNHGSLNYTVNTYQHPNLGQTLGIAQTY